MASLIQLEPLTTVPVEAIWRLSLAQYHSMIEQGILTPEDEVEFLEGMLVAKMPKNPLHTLITQLLRDVLAAHLPNGYFINVQEPLTLTDSEPEPDVMIVRGSRWDYASHHPSSADVALVIEVADSTLQRDRQLKRRLYAEAGVAVYWVVNVSAQQVECYSQVGDGEYQALQVYASDDFIPLMIDGQTIDALDVSRLFLANAG